MMFYFESILQIWIILIGFRDTNDFVNFGICKHKFKFTCRGYCRLTLTLFDMGGHDGPRNVFDHCAQTLRKRKLKLGDF